jgi:hypothetical protein
MLRYANTIDVFWDDSTAFDNFIELGSPPWRNREDNRVEADAKEEIEAKSEFIKLLKDSIAEFYDCKLSRLRRVRR